MIARRIPVVPTLLVGAAVAMMIWLGVWQIHRLHWKEALLARYATNQHLPTIALPTIARATLGGVSCP